MLTVLNKVKPLLVVLGWATSIASLTVGGILSGFLLPVYGGGGDLQPEVIYRGPWELILFYLGIFGVSVVASLVIADFGKAVIAFFASYILAATVTYLIIALPAFVGAFPVQDVLVTSAVKFTFGAFFPILLFLGLAATIVGSALSERVL
jgi:hypothetical protein